MPRPTLTEYPEHAFFSRYINQVDSENVLDFLEAQGKIIAHLYENLPTDKEDYRYAEGKWSVKEVLGHITDAERIFAYRSLAFARGEARALPGFDENDYMIAADFNAQPLSGLLQQYKLVRAANLAMFGSWPEEVASRMGTANGNGVSARALMYMIAGHERHHLSILAERYGVV